MQDHLPIEAEIALALEESEHLLRQLTSLTEKGLITWRCTRYRSLELMPAIAEDKQETAYLSHSVLSESEYAGRRYLTEIGETLTIPGGEGSVTVELKVMCSGQCTASYTWDDFSTEAQVGFADAVLPQMDGSEEVLRGFQTTRIHTDYTPDYIVAHPLTVLGKRLHEEQRFMDYHRIVVDSAYRTKLSSDDNGVDAR